MAIWSILAAPLIMSVDLRSITPIYRDILLNKNMLAINQDKLGIMGKQFGKRNGIELWSKPLVNDKTAFVFLLKDPYGTPQRITISLQELGLTRYTLYNLYESFTGNLIGQYKYSSNFNCSVNPSGSVFAFWAEPSQVGKKIY
jgi:alpha-N-acetylgalactosaminidase